MRPDPLHQAVTASWQRQMRQQKTNDSSVKVLGDDTLRTIAQELVSTVRANVTIDWTLRENVRAQLRVLVKRILRKYGYPPDKQEKATETVLEQAALLSGEWVAV
jgi:type I restriction enzyme R subunit